MSGLRQSFLELVRTIGNDSGCHQLPERSFFYQGKQFPVCARCCGVFLGQLAAVLLFLCRRPLSGRSCGFLLCVMGTDWSLQELGVRESTNWRRLLTGFCGGLGLFGIYTLCLRRLWRLCRRGALGKAVL